jgi:periplasmic divalent cation tolerance protein
MSSGGQVSALVVLTTLANIQDARSLVSRLVNDRLVACGTIVENALSVYTWQGQLEETAETLVVLKTTSDRWDDLESAVHELHTYDVPELLALPVVEGLPAYLGWLADQTGDESE